MHTNSRGRAGRRGVTTVEFAMIAGPLFLFILGNIEFGRALMAVNCLEEAARSGARVAILRGATAGGDYQTHRPDRPDQLFHLGSLAADFDHR